MGGGGGGGILFSGAGDEEGEVDGKEERGGELGGVSRHRRARVRSTALKEATPLGRMCAHPMAWLQEGRGASNRGQRGCYTQWMAGQGGQGGSDEIGERVAAIQYALCRCRSGERTVPHTP